MLTVGLDLLQWLTDLVTGRLNKLAKGQPRIALLRSGGRSQMWQTVSRDTLG